MLPAGMRFGRLLGQSDTPPLQKTKDGDEHCHAQGARETERLFGQAALDNLSRLVDGDLEWFDLRTRHFRVDEAEAQVCDGDALGSQRESHAFEIGRESGF